MLKNTILLGLGLLPLLLKAQLTLNVQLPPAGFVQKDQLWNLILVNNKEDILDIYIQMNLQDAATGQTVLSASSGNILVGKGVKVIASNDVQPIVYNYNVPDLSRNYLPMGAYIICYQVKGNSRKDEPLAQECIHLNIDPLSPPLLSTPTDKSEVESPYPQFTWMPPSPYDMFTNLSYDLFLTEVLQGQSVTEAIQYNTPIYTRSNILQPYELYASSFTSLDTGKIYAWQVVAKNGLNYAAKTEIWTFKIKPPSLVKLIIEQSPFIKMKRDYPEKGIAPNSILKLSYINETTDSIATVQIVDLNNQSKRIPSFIIAIQPGENLIQYNLKKLISLEEGKIYEAQIINSRKEKWVMHFEARYYKDKKTDRN
jgi:hypothetical protein